MPSALRRLEALAAHPERRRMVKYGLVGGSGVFVNLGFTWFGNHFVFASLAEKSRTAGSFLLGILVSIFTNFLLHDAWTFRDRAGRTGSFPARLGRFYMVAAASASIQFATAFLLHTRAHVFYLLAQLFAIGVGLAFNYLVNNFWTFAHRD